VRAKRTLSWSVTLSCCTAALPSQLCLNARALLQGKFAEAEKSYGAALVQEPRNAEALRELKAVSEVRKLVERGDEAMRSVRPSCAPLHATVFQNVWATCGFTGELASCAGLLRLRAGPSARLRARTSWQTQTPARLQALRRGSYDHNQNASR
jgi:hypothetical protein